MWAVYKKELKSYLLTPIGYVFISIFMVIFSLYFLNLFLGSITNFEYLLYEVAGILNIL